MTDPWESAKHGMLNVIIIQTNGHFRSVSFACCMNILFCELPLVKPQSENCDKMLLGWMGRWWNKVTAEDFANFVSHLEHFFIPMRFLRKMCPDFPGDWCPQIFSRGVTQDLITGLRTSSCPTKVQHSCTTHPPNVAQLHNILLTCPTQPCTTLPFFAMQHTKLVRSPTC